MKVTLLMALTADGMIARHAEHFPDWTERADKILFRHFSIEAGVVIMGSKTYHTIGRPLPNRKNIVMTRSPQGRPRTKALVFTADPPGKILADLKTAGFDQAVLIGGATINSLFAEKGCIDEMILTYCPTVFGTGLSMFSHSMAMGLSLQAVRKIGENSVMVRYSVIK
jgi:dihydrofolate reductase